MQYRVNEHETPGYWISTVSENTCATSNQSVRVVRPHFSRVACSTSSAVDLRWSSKFVLVVFAFGLLSIASGMTTKTPHEQPFFYCCQMRISPNKTHCISASRLPESGTISLPRPTVFLFNKLSPQTSSPPTHLGKPGFYGCLNCL